MAINTIKTRASLFAVVAVVLLVAIGTAFRIHFQRADLFRVLSEQQAVLVSQAASELDRKLESGMRQLMLLSAHLAEVDGRLEPDRVRQLLAGQILSRQAFDELVVIDERGRLVADDPPRRDHRQMDISDRPYIRALFATGQPQISPPLRGQATHDPMVNLVAPIIDARGRRIGALLGVSLLYGDNMLGDLARRRIGSQGYFQVVTRDATPIYVMHPDRARILAPLAPAELDTLGNRLGSGGISSEWRELSDGGAALRTWSSLKNADWLLGAVLPDDEVLVSLHTVRTRALALSAIFVMVLGPLVWLVVWWLLQPLSRLHAAIRRSRSYEPGVDEGAGADGPGADGLGADGLGVNGLAGITRPGRQLDEIGELTVAFGELIRERNRQAAELVTISDAAPLGMFRTHPDGGLGYVNRTLAKMMQRPASDLLGDGWTRFLHPDDLDRAREGWNRCCAAMLPLNSVQRFVLPDGRVRAISLRASPVMLHSVAIGMVGTAQDITAQRESETALRESEHRVRAIADNIPALITYLDRDERYRFANRAYRDWMGIDPQRMIGRSMREVLEPPQYALIAPWVRQALTGVVVECERYLDFLDPPREVRMTLIPDRDESGTVVGVDLLAYDITAERAEERRLLMLTQRDGLTGLVNRAGYEVSLEEAMARSQSSFSRLALMYADIDHFKSINDRYGHPAGDALLKQFAARLTAVVRASDVVCRVGGDEFILIVEHIGEEENALLIADKIHLAMGEPFHVRGECIQVSVSVGAAVFHGSGVDRDELVKRADDALLAAKRAGRGRTEFAPL